MVPPGVGQHCRAGGETAQVFAGGLIHIELEKIYFLSAIAVAVVSFWSVIIFEAIYLRRGFVIMRD